MNALVAFAAASAAALLAMAVLCRPRHSIASWCFFTGMIAMACESAMHGLAMKTVRVQDAIRWETLALTVKSLTPGIWLCFSLTYSRGNYREFLSKWRIPLAAAFLLPVGLVFGFNSDLLQGVQQENTWILRLNRTARLLNGIFLLSSVLILTNLEKTFRTAVGTMRWRLKFAVLGLGLIFGAAIYTRSQVLLFSLDDPNLAAIETGALLIGCMLIAVAYMRRGFTDTDVYPSRAVLQSSLTLLIAGIYLFVVGVLAQVVARLGGMESFQTQVLIVLVGVTVLAVVLISDRFRQHVHRLISRHFNRPRHDYGKIWTSLTERTSNVLNQGGLFSGAAKFISETFDALSVTIWTLDEQKKCFTFGASTSQTIYCDNSESDTELSVQAIGELQTVSRPVDLEEIRCEWAAVLRRCNPGQFPNGGNRLCVPLIAGNRRLGVVVLADRVNGAPYALDEMDLLACIANQVGAGLLNVRLANELMQAKELEALQTMSAFFVHDLKNAASSLSLMLENLPTHFDDPAFRVDALRGLASSVGRINHFIDRLSALRHKLDIRPEESDLNQLVNAALGDFGKIPDLELVKELEALPSVFADRDQIRSVVTNLLHNAKDAVNGTGQIRIKTSGKEDRVVLSVEDNGCGMTAEFLRDSLFRPFHTTKKKGLGIGMFQSKIIIEAHGGSMVAHSRLDHGTTFVVTLPLKPRI